MGSAPGALPREKRLLSLVIFQVGRSSNVLSTGTCASPAMSSSLIVDGQLSTLLRFSNQRSSNFSLSEIIVLPSALRKCGDPDEVGQQTVLRAL